MSIKENSTNLNTAIPTIETRIDKLVDDPGSKIKAFASVTIGGMFAVHGLKVMDSAKGMFVSMPYNSYKDAQGETRYQDVFHAVTSESRQAIIDSVSQAYEQALSQSQTESSEIAAAPENSAEQNM